MSRKKEATMPIARAGVGPTRIAVIGNYIPRRCGIATFTADLAESLAAEAPDSEVWAVAVNDTPDGYHYPGRVHFEISEQSRGDYRVAAEFLNISPNPPFSLPNPVPPAQKGFSRPRGSLTTTSSGRER